jgi:hypothetical protein
MTSLGWLHLALHGDYVVQIGQLSRADVRVLDRAARAGILVRYRGYWNTGSSLGGLGALKTCWRAAA